MKLWLPHYIGELYQDVPCGLYVGLVSVVCVIAVLVFSLKGFKRGCSIVFNTMTVEYIVLLYGATVLFRPYLDESRYNFTPFWSYYEIQRGRGDLLAESIMNIVVFMPVGLFLGCASRSVKWWMVLLMGLGLSFSIETLQFVFKRGFSEFDDVFHNTIGCMMGYGLYSLIRFGYKKVFKRNVGVL